MSDEQFKELIGKIESVMAALIILILIVIYFGIGAVYAHSQELPAHPQPQESSSISRCAIANPDGTLTYQSQEYCDKAFLESRPCAADEMDCGDIGTGAATKGQWPKQSFTKRAVAYTTSNDHYLLALDGSLRSLDMKTTHDLLSNPCHCFKEDDPIAPHDGNYAKQALFQGGMTALITLGHYELAKHNHPKWARALVLADIASESYAVGHNMSLPLPKPLPAVPVVAPVTKGAFQ